MRVKLVIVVISALIVAYGFLGGVVETAAVGDDPFRDLSIFVEVLHKVRKEYVENPRIDNAMKGALQGMVEALDGYSSYVDSVTYKTLSQREGDASPGLILSKRFGYIYVVSVIPNSPAAAQGLRTGDLVESIEGEPTASMSLWEAQQRLDGPDGSEVEVRAIRARRTEPTQIRLRRAMVEQQSISARREGDIGVVRIPQLLEGAAESVAAQLSFLKKSGAKGILVDLRGTALGEFEEAVRLSGLFVPKGTEVMSLRNRDGSSESFRTESDPQLIDLPIVVLIDGGTSGAAEVLASALQESGVAETLGARTNGQGGVQESFRLKDGSVLILSTRQVFRSSGAPLHGDSPKKSGLTPDLRWPRQDFVTNFYYENVPESDGGEIDDDFYRRLNEAIEAEQFRKAVEKIQANLLNKAAA